MRAFRELEFVSGLPNRQSQGANRRKSPATPANIPVLQRLSAETGFDHDCRLDRALDFAFYLLAFRVQLFGTFKTRTARR